jgi:protein arginine N-methyltransferase 1
MGCIKSAAIKEPLVDVVEDRAINSKVCQILDLDLLKISKDDIEFSH